MTPPTRLAARPVSLIVLSGILRVVDIALILLSGLITVQLCLPALVRADRAYPMAILAGGLVALVVFHCNGLYKPAALGSGSFRLVPLCRAWGAVLLVLVVLAYVLRLSMQYSRFWFGVWAVASLLGMAGCRVGYGLLERRWLRSGRLTRSVVVLGSGRHAARLIEKLTAAKLPGVNLLGWFDDRTNRVDPALAPLGYRRLGSVADLVQYARLERVDQVIVALPWSAEHRVLEILRQLRSLPVDIHLAPDMVGFSVAQSTYSMLGGIALLQVFQKPLADWPLVIKEIEDRVLAALFLFMLAPLLLILAALVKLDSPGPVFFRQQRYGFNNRLIGVYKFRSMHHHLRDEKATQLATRHDVRVTRIGRFLRRSSLDELPQLFNVLLGDMSIVGPRPHALSAKAADRLYEDVVAEYAARHRVKPGITGWAQVNGWRGETDTYEKIRKRVEYDLYYIEHWSFVLDIKILLMTIIALLKSENAY